MSQVGATLAVEETPEQKARIAARLAAMSLSDDKVPWTILLHSRHCSSHIYSLLLRLPRLQLLLPQHPLLHRPSRRPRAQ